jgi:hypothetical protein
LSAAIVLAAAAVIGQASFWIALYWRETSVADDNSVPPPPTKR